MNHATSSTAARTRTEPRTASGGHVALLLPNLDIGGAERITCNLARSLSAAGHAVDLVVGSADGPLRSEVPSGVPVVDLGTRSLRTAVLPMVRYLRQRRPAAVLPTIGHADLLAILATAVAGTGTQVVPRVSNTLSHARSDGLPLRVRAVRALTHRAYRHVPVLVACSHGMAADLVDHIGIQPERVRVLPNATIGSELQELAAADVDHPWLDGDRTTPTLLAVGSLIPQKNHALLLEAIARVRAVRAVRLVVLGEGPLRPELERRILELGLTGVVDLHGTDTNPYRYMARCDAFVLSSDWEGLPGVLIEAVGIGANTISTDCPSGPREILDGGRHGRLVEPGDPEALARAILAALEAPIRPTAAAWEPYTGTAAAQAYEELLIELGVW